MNTEQSSPTLHSFVSNIREALVNDGILKSATAINDFEGLLKGVFDNDLDSIFNIISKYGQQPEEGMPGLVPAAFVLQRLFADYGNSFDPHARRFFARVITKQPVYQSFRGDRGQETTGVTISIDGLESSSGYIQCSDDKFNSAKDAKSRNLTAPEALSMISCEARSRVTEILARKTSIEAFKIPGQDASRIPERMTDLRKEREKQSANPGGDNASPSETSLWSRIRKIFL